MKQTKGYCSSKKTKNETGTFLSQSSLKILFFSAVSDMLMIMKLRLKSFVFKQ